MLSAPPVHASNAAARDQRTERCGAATNTGMGAIQSSHHTGCNPIPKKNANEDKNTDVAVSASCLAGMRIPPRAFYAAERQKCPESDPGGEEEAGGRVSATPKTGQFLLLQCSQLIAP